MTAPIGRRRTQAAICSGVGSSARLASAASARWAAAGRAAHGLRWAGAARGLGSGREDQRDVAGAEAARDGGEVGGGALVQRGGEFAAVVDISLRTRSRRRPTRLGWLVGAGAGHTIAVDVKEYFP
ncbi:MAG TPA: hypothetical protein VKI44_21915 [Acetobacteraceae bacterium]|nr:hypothetical protein [Acetobacteraceae bacterium]